MIDRKVPRARQASRKECRELSKLPWVLDEELSDDTWEVRLLPDGRALLYLRCEEKGPLYPSREALAEQLRKGEETRKQSIAQLAGPPIDPTLELLPPITDFLRDVEAHAKSLGKVLRIPDDALDFTEASLDAVDAGLKRVRPAAKRLTPEILTPLVAYVGEVMRRALGGRWSKSPTTVRKRVPVYDPTELAAAQATLHAHWTAGLQAVADIKARGGSEAAQARAHPVRLPPPPWPNPIRYDVVEEPVVGHENEPRICMPSGHFLQPFALVFIPMAEPSKRVSVRSAVDIELMRHRPAKQAGAQGSTT